jgi:LacI family transcriptional regulator
MTNQVIKVVIAVPTFKSVLHTTMFEHLRKMLKPDEMALRSVGGEAPTQKDHLMRALSQTHPTGLITIDVKPDAETIAAYSDAGAPIVLIDDITSGVSTITVDNYLGGKIAGDHLVKIGRKRIAIVSGRTKLQGSYNAEQRLKGFQQALANGHLSLMPGCKIEVPEYSREDGIVSMPKLLDLNVDAIFCAAGDNCALGLVSVAREKKVRIPDDVAIIGFDDLLIAQISTPKLTTVRQPLTEMIEAAYDLVVTKRNEVLHKPKSIVFNPELIVRQSA